jgi:hypothetical protein
MQYAYAYQLNGTQAGGLDPDAKAYINAVVAAGATVSGTQRSAINTFVKTGKTNGWYSSLKRIYLPIWGVAAPNAICMTSLTSGTFVGGVTHSSGYVTTNGSTGHFLSDASPGQAGCTLNGGGVFVLISAASSLSGSSLTTATVICGAATSVSTTRTTLTGNSVTTLFAGFGPNSSTFGNYLTSGDRRGVVNFQRNSSADRFLLFRNSSGEVNTGLLANASGSLNNTIPMAFMANNVNGAVSAYVPATVYNGAWGMTDGFDIAKSQLFTASLKTLWETCTGLALP